MVSTKIYYELMLWLMSFQGIGRRKAFECISAYSDPMKLYRGDQAALGIASELLEISPRSLINQRDLSRMNDIYIERTRSADAVISIWDEAYPESLKQVNDPPLMLHLRGQCELINAETFGVAVVGTRRPSEYGRHYGEQIGRMVGKMGEVVISGLALGIDAAAHQGCLAVKGQTIAVLGTGVDICYPRYNHKLFSQIQQTGLLISEYPAGSQAHPIHFPERNRIIAGLSHSAVVIEAAKKSGSLITAEMVMDMGREVFALPGPINSPHSVGCHELIRHGASPIVDMETLEEDLIQISGKGVVKSAYITHEGAFPNFDMLEGLAPAEANFAQQIYEMLKQNGPQPMASIIDSSPCDFGTTIGLMDLMVSKNFVKCVGFLYHI